MMAVGTWRRWLTWVGVCVLAAAAPSAQEAAQQPTFRGGARFVRVDVYPTDGEGRPIAGLTVDDFELLEDGKPQTIDTFEFVRVEPEPEIARVDPDSQAAGEALAKDPRARVFAIVLDTRHVDVGAGRAMRQPLTAMLDDLIGPRDMFGVITPQLPAGSFVLGRRTTTVADMMSRYWYWGTDDTAVSQDATETLITECGLIPNKAGRRLDPHIVQEWRERHRERDTLAFLDRFIDKLGTIREERKSLVLVTQGYRLFTPNMDAMTAIAQHFDQPNPGMGIVDGRLRAGGTDQRTPGRVDPASCVGLGSGLMMADTHRAHRDLMTKAQRANVAFYPVDPRGIPVFDAPINEPMKSLQDDQARLQSRVHSLRELAVNTDGIAFVRDNDLRAQLSRLTESFSSYYLLGYYSTNTKFDGGYRKLSVRVKRPGVRLTARRGYIAPTEAEMAAIAEGRAAAGRPPSVEAAALAGALARLEELRHDRDLFVQTARAGDAIIVNVELGVNARTSPAWAEGGSIRVAPAGEAGDAIEAEIAPMRSGVSLRFPVSQMGEQRLDVRARAKHTGVSAAADTSATVAARVESLLGEPLAYRGIARARFPAADGRYRRTERATIEAVLAPGAAPAGVRLLDKTGAPLTTPAASRERVDESGIRWMVAEVSLAPFTDGDYVIELEAMKDESRERKLFAIRVVR